MRPERRLKAGTDGRSSGGLMIPPRTI